MKNSKKQKSQTASQSLPSRKPANSSNYELTPSENESQVPYEVYLAMSEAERAAIPYERKPYELTPSEIASLRQDSIESSKRMCAMLGLDYETTTV